MNVTPNKQRYLKIESFLGGAKFAVILILVFALLMIIGTVMESFSGAEYAKRTLYKAPLFMWVQFFFFICVTLAALLRLPPQKRLYGFYTVHSGLVIIVGGSFITYYAGIDGHLQLYPMGTSREVVLKSDQITVHFKDRDIKYVLETPYQSGVVSLGQSPPSIPELKFIDYYPFASLVDDWNSTTNSLNYPSGEFQIANDFTSSEFILSLHPSAKDFNPSQSLGPLTVLLLPSSLSRCLQALPSKNEYFFFNPELNQCYLKNEIQTIEKNLSEKKFIGAEINGEKWGFIPSESPFPVKELLETVIFDERSPVRIFYYPLLGDSPMLLISGGRAFWTSAENSQWDSGELAKGQPLPLPWMNFNLTPLKMTESEYPVKVAQSVRPIQENGEVVVGADKAVNFELYGQKRQLISYRPQTVLIGDEWATLTLMPKSLTLPFEITLKKFKMDTDPGTRNPASYESFIDLFDQSGLSTHHIYMNNPLHYKGLTFYQASYFEDPNSGEMGSVLAVSYDPGLNIKYFGSLLLVFGTLWHFYLRRKKVS